MKRRVLALSVLLFTGLLLFAGCSPGSAPNPVAPSSTLTNDVPGCASFADRVEAASDRAGKVRQVASAYADLVEEMSRSDEDYDSYYALLNLAYPVELWDWCNSPYSVEVLPQLLAGQGVSWLSESYSGLSDRQRTPGFLLSDFERFDAMLRTAGTPLAQVFRASFGDGEIARLESGVRGLSGGNLLNCEKPGLSALIRLAGPREVVKRFQEQAASVSDVSGHDLGDESGNSRALYYDTDYPDHSHFESDTRVAVVESLAEVGGEEALAAIREYVLELARRCRGGRFSDWRSVPVLYYYDDSPMLALLPTGFGCYEDLVTAARAYGRAGGSDVAVQEARSALAEALFDRSSSDLFFRTPESGFDFIWAAEAKESIWRNRPLLRTPAALTYLLAQPDENIVGMALCYASQRFPPEVIAECMSDAMKAAHGSQSLEYLVVELGSLRRPEGIRALATTADNLPEDSCVVSTIMLALSRIGGPEAVKALLALRIKSGYDDASFADLLRQAGDDEILKRALEAETDPVPRALIERALSYPNEFSPIYSSPCATLAHLPEVLSDPKLEEYIDLVAETLNANPDVRSRAVPLLRNLVSSGPESAVGNACILLAVLAPDKADCIAGALERALRARPAASSVKKTARALGVAGRPDGSAALVAGLEVEDIETAKEVLTALERIGEPAVESVLRGLESDSPLVRARCAVFLGARRDPVSSRLLSALSRETDPLATVAMLDALSVLGGDIPGGFAVPFLASPSARVRRAAARACFHRPVADAGALLAGMSKSDGDIGARFFACTALSRLPGKDSLGALLDVASDDSTCVSKVAFLLLSVRDDCPAGPVIKCLEAFISRAEAAPSPGFLERDEEVLNSVYASLHACALHSWPEALPLLEKIADNETALSSLDETTLGRLVAALSSYSRLGVPALVRLFLGPSARYRASIALAAIGGGPVGRALEQCFRDALADESDSTVAPLAFRAMHCIDAEYSEEIWLARAHYYLKMNSTDALCRLALAAFLAPFKGATPDLAKMIARGDISLSRMAAVALAQTGGSKEAAALLASKEPVVLASALLVLAANPDRSVLDAIGALMTHPDPLVRRGACFALAACGDAKASAPFILDALAKTDWKAVVRDDEYITRCVDWFSEEHGWTPLPENAVLLAAMLLPDPRLAPALVKLAREGNPEALIPLVNIDAPEALTYAVSGSFLATEDAPADWFPVLYVSRYGGLGQADSLISYLESRPDPFRDSEYSNDLLRAAITGLGRMTGSSCGYDANAWREAVRLARGR